MPWASKDLRFVLGAGVAALVVVELGLRLAGLDPGEVSPHYDEKSDTRWSQLDAKLGWRNRPGPARSVECGEVTMTFREDGSRLTPSEPTTAPATLFFGASYVQGYGVADDATFVELLNREAPEEGFRSYGTGGFNTLQARLLAEEILDGLAPEEQPERVVYAFTQGDTKRNVARSSVIMNLRGPGGRFAVPPHLRVRDGRETRRPASRIEPMPGAQHFALAMLLQRVVIAARFNVGDDERWLVSRRLAEEFAAAMEARGLPFDIVLFESEEEIREAVFGASSLNPVDCRFEDRPELSVCGNGSGHPGPQVHAHWARCIRDWLAEQPANQAGPV